MLTNALRNCMWVDGTKMDSKKLETRPALASSAVHVIIHYVRRWGCYISYVPTFALSQGGSIRNFKSALGNCSDKAILQMKVPLQTQRLDASDYCLIKGNSVRQFRKAIL